MFYTKPTKYVDKCADSDFSTFATAYWYGKQEKLHDSWSKCVQDSNPEGKLERFCSFPGQIIFRLHLRHQWSLEAIRLFDAHLRDGHTFMLASWLAVIILLQTRLNGILVSTDNAKDNCSRLFSAWGRKTNWGHLVNTNFFLLTVVKGV